MLATLTGLGLSAAAGLNAFVPLLVVGFLSRYTDAIPLGHTWQWLEHPATLTILTVLLAVELVADKVPALDSLNDTLQTFVRPTSGGITFAAGSTSVPVEAPPVDDVVGQASGAVVAGGAGPVWIAVLVGALIALAFHVVKTLARPVANTATLGCAAPVLSAFEDAVSFVTSLLAMLLPVLVLVVLPLLVFAGFLLLRRRRRARALQTGAGPAPGIPDTGGGESGR
ncbi:DUF4126 domain-containing protein [Nocardiopsis salina]|uniref:DUF4126 domain-containing protein n=1 Tax=Nocardiopsis salina TaxID=245836 RepID=UPI0003495A98|nr:DUF4126 domain-containing protein [Nocardiopsis salina]